MTADSQMIPSITQAPGMGKDDSYITDIKLGHRNTPLPAAFVVVPLVTVAAVGFMIPVRPSLEVGRLGGERVPRVIESSARCIVDGMANPHVVRFVAARVALLTSIPDIAAQLARHFKSPVQLNAGITSMHDSVVPEEFLVITVRSTLPLEAAWAALDRFDREWWVEQSAEVRRSAAILLG
jgi:hypothetical protein